MNIVLDYTNCLIPFDLLKLEDKLIKIKDATDLTLANNQLRIQELVLLEDFLFEAKNLKKLDLSHNFLSSKAAEKIALLLSQYDKLEELNLSDNPLRDEGLKCLLPVLSNLNNLKVIKLNHCQLVNIKALAKTLLNLGVHHLEISSNSIEVGIGDLGTTNLHTLILQENKVHNSINTLSIVDIKKIIDENKNLILLDIRNNKFIYPKVFADIQKANPQLQLIFNNDIQSFAPRQSPIAHFKK